MSERWRTGSHWGRTIIRYDDRETPDSQGHRPSDQLIGVMDTERLARRAVDAVNELHRDTPGGPQ